MLRLLSEIKRSDVLLVGGKAASLGEMIHEGIQVPPGFVITVEAFNLGMSKYLEETILHAFDKLAATRVAVRSSAIAEDSSQASWAGQLDTYLNVRRDGLINAVQQCWQSINSSHAKFYAAQNNVNADLGGVAVVIQAMIDSEISGVMFTTNPANNNLEQCVIEAVHGLGELLVQGSVTPESIIINKKTGERLDYQASDQKKKLIYKDNKNQVVSFLKKGQPILDEGQISQLLKVAQQIEKHYKVPQDIEWAINKGKLYIVQSRPITTLGNFNKITPHTYKNRVIPFDEKVALFRWGPIRGRYFLISDYIVAACIKLQDYAKGEHFPKTLLLFNKEQMVWICDQHQFISNGKRIFDQYIENPLSLKKFQEDYRVSHKKLIEMHQQFAKIDLQLLSNNEFHDLWQYFYKTVTDFWLPTLLPELANYGAPDLLKEELSTYIKTEEELTKAMETLTAPDELSFYQNEELDLLATTDLKVHQGKYYWLKNSYGSVQVLSVEFFQERKKQLNKKKIIPNKQKIKEATLKAKQVVKTTYGLPKSTMLKAELIANNLVWQDDRKRYITENFHFKMQLLKELARRINIDSEVLISYGFEELMAIVTEPKRKSLLKDRETSGIKFDKEITTVSETDASALWELYEENKTPQDQTIKGIVACMGNGKPVRGRVRVLRSSHAILEPGEVLVASMTSPGYVFAMRNAIAIITDIGGLTSHAAIVSRELGVPCVVGTKNATKVLKDGYEVEVDPVKSTVEVINRPNLTESDKDL